MGGKTIENNGVEKKEEGKYDKLLALFENSLQNSRDYRIGILQDIGYIAVSGTYYPDAETGHEAAVHLNVEKVMRTPKELASELLENWRWQWYYQHPQVELRDEYDNVRELDSDMPKRYREEFFSDLRQYQKRIGDILGEDISDL